MLNRDGEARRDAKVVVVTGAGRGIGRAIAARAAVDGFQTVLVSRTRAELESVAAEIAQTGAHVPRVVVCDVGVSEQVQSLARELREQGLRPYGVVCAAGVYGPIGPLETNSLAEWESALNINLLGTVRVLHALIPDMKAAGEGRVVLLSGGGQGAMPNFTSYVSSKGGIVRLGESLAAELQTSGIYLNTLAPGAVNTKFLDEVLAAGPGRAGAEFYRRSLRQKEEGGASADRAAALVAYLLSDRSRGLYGKLISALWDEYESWDVGEELSRSDRFTLRRVVDVDGGTRSS
jgi:NAD(P)-dependent dehydrogenase (short-subunit alcohol dehydrogenase family)